MAAAASASRNKATPGPGAGTLMETGWSLPPPVAVGWPPPAGAGATRRLTEVDADLPASSVTVSLTRCVPAGSVSWYEAARDVLEPTTHSREAILPSASVDVSFRVMVCPATGLAGEM